MATAPRSWTPQSAVDQRLPSPPKPMYPFFLVQYSTGWAYHEERVEGEIRGEFFPQPCEFPHVPGVNGVQDPARVGQAPNTQLAIGSVIGKGGTVVRPDDERLGEYRYFINVYECQNNDRAFCWAWAKPRLQANGTVVWRTDEARHQNFLRFIRDHGLIPALTIEAWEMLEQRQLRLIEGLPARYHHSGAALLAEKYAAATARLDRMRAAWSAIAPEDDGIDVEPTSVVGQAGPQPVSSADLGLDGAPKALPSKPRLTRSRAVVESE